MATTRKATHTRCVRCHTALDPVDTPTVRSNRHCGPDSHTCPWCKACAATRT